MARTQLPTTLIADETIVRADLNVSTSGSAVIRKLVQGTGITISSTGADPGTGDVTVSINTSSVVTSFNSRTGAVTLSSADVTGALGFTPISGESDTLATVTTRGAVTTNSITIGGLTVAGGDILLDNDRPIRWKDSTGTSRRAMLITAANDFQFGPVDTGWAGNTYIKAGTSMQFLVNGASGSSIAAMTINTLGRVTLGGTTNGGYTLDVQGTLRTTGAITASGGINAGITGYGISSIPANTAFINDTTRLNQTPAAWIWHDLLAFNRLNGSYETYNGTSWSAGTLNTELFAQKQNQSISIIDNVSVVGARWTFNSVNASWSLGEWLVLGITWVASPATVSITLESWDGTAWVTRHTSSTSVVATNYFAYVSPYNGEYPLRLTVLRTGGGSSFSLSNIQLLTSRPGDQGGGSEDSVPFYWNGSRNIGLGTAASSTYRLDVNGLLRTNNSAHFATSGGNVLIGTTTDAGYKLDVNGTARTSGQHTVATLGFTGGTSTISSIGNAYINFYTRGFRGFDLFNGSSNAEAQKVLIGDYLTYGVETTRYASAMLIVESVTKGFLQPRMTNTQVNAITTPTTGLQAYDTTNNKNLVYDGTAWRNIATENWVAAQGYLTSYTEVDTLASVTTRGASTTNSITVGGLTSTGTILAPQSTSSLALANASSTNLGLKFYSSSLMIFIAGEQDVVKIGSGYFATNTALTFGSQASAPYIGYNGNNLLVNAGTLSGTGYTAIQTGNLLVGTTTDAGYKLDVNGTARFSGNTYLAGDILVSNGSGTRYIQASNGSIGFLSSNSSGYNLWTSNSNVGIKSELYINSDLNYNTGIRLRIGSTQTSPSGYSYELSFNPQVGHVPTNTVIRTLDSAYSNNAATTPSPIYIFGGQNTTSGAYADLILQSDFTTNRGRVGIGTTSPGYKLHVNGNIHTQDGLHLGGNADWLYPSSNSGFLEIQSGQGIKINAGNALSAFFTSGGNVLIGTTTNAGYKLDVNGSFRSIGTADVLSNITFHRLNSGLQVDIDSLSTFILSKTDGSYGSGTKPSGAHNGFAVISFQTHLGNYYTQLGLDTNQNELWIRSANSTTTYGAWARLWNTDDFTTGNVNNWNTAFSWGNHATAGYLTGTPTLQAVSAAGSTTTNAITIGGLTVNNSFQVNLTGVSTGWSRLSYTASTAWGDAVAYGVLGASGGNESGVMTYNQHAVWTGSSAGAGIRMGRSGGVSSGAWYQVATMDSDEFMIAKNGSWANGGLKITSDGILRYGTTGYRYVWENGTWGINISGNAATATTASALTSMNISQFTNNSGYITSSFYSWTNPNFGQVGTKSNIVDNVLYSAGDRFEVFKDGVAWNTNSPFNLNYDQTVDVIAVNTSRTYSIILNTKGNSASGITYTEGTVYLSFYYTYIPGSVSGRVRDQGGTWRNITGWTNVSSSGSYAVWRGNVPGFNYMVEMEITITANASNNTWFTQWEYVMGRPGQFELGIINKAQDNSIWRNLYFRNSSNTIGVTINSGGISTASHGSSANWKQAYDWGNHATAGYLTSIPTLAQVTSAGNSTTNSITVGSITATSNAVANTFWTGIGYKNNNNGNMGMVFSGSDIILYTGSSSALDTVHLFGATQNVGIGSTTDAGYKLDVNGNAILRSGTLNLVGNYLGITGTCADVNIFNNCGSAGNVSFSLGGNKYLNIFQVVGSSSGYTSGAQNTISSSITYAWSSGTANSNLFVLSPTINNTGTYSGIFRGFYYNPTLTSLTGTTHRAIETVSGDVVFGSTSGNVMIGTTTSSSYRLDVNGIFRLGPAGGQLYSTAGNTLWANFGNVQLGVGSSGGESIDLSANSTGEIRFGTASVQRMVIKNSGNVLIGTNTDSGYKFDVSGTARVLAGSENVLRVEHTNGNYATILIGAGSTLAAGQMGMYFNGSPIWSWNGSAVRLHGNMLTTAVANQTMTVAGGYGGGTSAGVAIKLVSNSFNAGTQAPTTGTQTNVEIGTGPNETWGPSSGTATWNLLRLAPTLNTSGSYSGIVRGLYYNPTLTATTGVTHRAIETTTGDVIFASTSGKVGIGISNPVEKLEVSGSIKSTALTVDGVVKSVAGVLTSVAGFTGMVNIQQPAPMPPIMLDIQNGIVVNVM